jgi:excinuclease ABC subunit C
MKDIKGEILYVGKAANLKRRVSSYFTRPHDSRIERMVSYIVKVDYKETDSAIEALILEAELIKKHTPPFNVREKDDKSFLCVEITREKFPRVLLARGKDAAMGRRFGPFTSASNIREALRLIRKIFKFNTHPPEKIGVLPRPCFDCQVGLCPGTCVGLISKEDYAKTVRNIKLFFEGKKAKIIRLLQAEMKAAAKELNFERAEKLRREIFALQHIQDVAFISDNEIADPQGGEFAPRIEGYDISNISGTSPVGSMVVFKGGAPDKNEYRKFRIKTVTGANDVGMLKEMLERRFRHSSEGEESGRWPLPQAILVDGGLAQVNAARKVLQDHKLKIPVLGIVKGPDRKRNDIVGIVPKGITLQTLVKVRDEAHRFAISYHKKVRGREFLR